MAAIGDRKSTGSNFGCMLRCEFSPHSFSQSSSDGTVTSAFVPQSGTTAGQVGVFRAGMMLHSGSQVLSRLKKADRHFQTDGDFAGSERFPQRCLTNIYSESIDGTCVWGHTLHWGCCSSR
jgi:hypothetical protein